eukprot:scaffold109097_cov66-Phaeocystis_antarctica.AAC.3
MRHHVASEEDSAATDRQTQTDRQFGRKTHSEQLGCCATHLRRHNSAPWQHHTARPTRPHGCIKKERQQFSVF